MLSFHRAMGTWSKKISTYIALTEFSRQKLIEGGLPSGKIMVKPNFIANDLGQGEGQGKYALYVGRLSSEKGITTLLAAWHLLDDNIALRIVGDGPLSEMVSSVAVSSSAVEYLGRLDNDQVLYLMRNAQFLVFPSLCYENFPLTIIEAFAAGLPVLTSDIGNAANSEQSVRRVYGPDLMLAMCESSVERGYKHFFYGGAEGVPELLAEEMKKRFPGLRIAGACSPPFRELSQEEENKIVEMINQADPDIIWVGLGTPKQDLWMAKNRPRLNAPVMIAVGAAFDFHTKRVAQAPMWMQQAGLEWLFRLFQEPCRLWHRYLIYNPLYILKVIEQRLDLRRYELDTPPDSRK